MSNTMIATPIFECVVPLVPPGINQAYQPVIRASKEGQDKPALIDTRKERQFKRDFRLLLSQWQQYDVKMVNAIRAAVEPIPLEIHLSFFFKDVWHQDGDNGIKSVQDLVCAFLLINDRCFTDWVVKKRQGESHTEVEVFLSEWEPVA